MIGVKFEVWERSGVSEIWGGEVRACKEVAGESSCRPSEIGWVRPGGLWGGIVQVAFHRRGGL